MGLSVDIPLQVLGIGIIISYGIAILIQVLLLYIRMFTKKQEDRK